jgi:hypothetical protein
MQSLGCVLAATVRGARGSRVPLIIGLSCTRRSRRRRATEPHFHAPGWAARPMTTDKDEVPASSPGVPLGQRGQVYLHLGSRRDDPPIEMRSSGTG